MKTILRRLEQMEQRYAQIAPVRTCSAKEAFIKRLMGDSEASQVNTAGSEETQVDTAGSDVRERLLRQLQQIAAGEVRGA